MDLSNENVIHIKKSGIQYLQFKKLLEYNEIVQHCFTLKPLDFGNNDTYEHNKKIITENYKTICNCLNLDYNNIIRPFQVHSNSIKTVTEKGIFLDEYQNIDGLITSKPNQILSLTYADCIPLYFFDSNKKIIANIHSGWQGTLKKIGKIAVEKLIKEYNSKCEDIICVIGPCIRKCHFEVDEEVQKEFSNKFTEIVGINDLISKGNIIKGKQKYYIDTVEINRRMLKEEGLKEENIIDSKICTVCNSDLIYSYRGNDETMCRNTSLICLKNI